MEPGMINEILKRLPELAGTGILESANTSIQRYMGADQGDSTGDDGTSSDSDDEGAPGGLSSIVTRALQGRSKVLHLTSLKHLSLAIIMKNASKLAASNKQKILFQHTGENRPEVLNLILYEFRPENQIPFYAMFDHYERGSGEFVGMLLHKKLEEFNFDILKEKGDYSKLWPVLIKKCPNLKKIAVDRFCTSSKTKEQVPIRQLMHFKKLLEIVMPEYLCDDLAMEKISASFPKLKHLNVTFENLSAKGLTHLFKLKHLEKLEFSLNCGAKVKNESKEKYNSTLISKCLENMPNLKHCSPRPHISGLYQTVGLTQYHKKNKSKKNTLKLEKLSLDKSLGIPPERLPEVREVSITGQINCAKELAKFKHLEILDMSVIASEHAMHILERVGKQIKHLRIDNEYMQGAITGLESSKTVYDFYEIFSCCPNLEIFDFGGMKFKENPSIQLTAANFSKLRSVNISMFDMQGYQMPMPIVEHILRAKNLEYLQLYWTRCLPKALFNVLNENKDHFQKLKFLFLKRMWVKNYKGYIKSLKRLIVRAPRLEKLGIMCCEQGVGDFKKSGLSQLLEQIPGFDYKTDYKDGFYF